MALDVTVIVATYGRLAWVDLAQRALRSARDMAPVQHWHEKTLHDARNQGLAHTDTEWVCFLDADDELTPGFFDHMATGTADLRAPSVQYVKRNGRVRPPGMPQVAGHNHACTADCLADGNWMVIGTVARTELLTSVGGWRDYPVYEDWDLWQRCWLAGATIEAIPSAVYRAHIRPDSRNRGTPMEFRNATHRQIVAANMPQAVA